MKTKTPPRPETLPTLREDQLEQARGASGDPVSPTIVRDPVVIIPQDPFAAFFHS